MNRAARPAALAACALASAFALLGGCAAPGEPTARHPAIPAAVTDLSVRQYGNAFVLSFTLPTRSTDRELLPEHPAMEIDRAILPPGRAAPKAADWRVAYAVPSSQVDRYLNGERIEFRDTLAPDDFSKPAGTSVAYKVRTSAAKARTSQDSNVTTTGMYPPPDAPADVRAEVEESAIVLHWADAAVPPGASSRGYHVYRGVAAEGEAGAPQDASPVKLKGGLELAGSASATEYRDAQFEFGTSYAYTVRTAAQFGSAMVESADSAPALVTPRDVFPPAAPTGLEINVMPATGAAPPYIELSWAINPEADLAGYAVYRSLGEEAPGERISTEILPSPTFRDISVEPGQRYFYRVTALDRAGNESPKSSAVAADVPKADVP